VHADIPARACSPLAHLSQAAPPAPPGTSWHGPATRHPPTAHPTITRSRLLRPPIHIRISTVRVCTPGTFQSRVRWSCARWAATAVRCSRTTQRWSCRWCSVCSARRLRSPQPCTRSQTALSERSWHSGKTSWIIWHHCHLQTNIPSSAVFGANSWYPLDYYSPMHPGNGVGIRTRLSDPETFGLARRTVPSSG
jgi:hypothetical protein